MLRSLRSLAGVAAAMLLAAACSHGAGSTNADPLRLCALYSACEPDDLGPFGVFCGGLVAGEAIAALGAPASPDCLAKANGCAEFDACKPNQLPKLTPAEVAACSSAGGATACVADVLVQCGPSGYATACPFFLDEVNCPGSGCQWQPSETCGVVGGVAQCVGDGPACNFGPEMSTCHGNTVVACTGGKTATFDCASIDLACHAGAVGAGCMTAETDCDDLSAESCADGVLTFCLNGTTTTLDCTSYGLSGCAMIPGSAPPSVRCTP